MNDETPASPTPTPLNVPSAPPPGTPLVDSYTYHSPQPTTKGPYILGVDEAGRGPVLGPMVYGIAYCPVAYKDTLEEMGFADSKTLTYEIRSNLLETLSSDPENLGWSIRSLSVNLNEQAKRATILLIQEVVEKGIEVSEAYVDALGPEAPWQEELTRLFPSIAFTVTKKADMKFKIVGAASVAAKVTRDACIEGWTYEETHSNPNAKVGWTDNLGSGYPSDPSTKAWIEASIEPTFGYPSIARFSWGTVKVALEKKGHDVVWVDEQQKGVSKMFTSAQGLDKDRSLVMKDLSIHSVASF
ncbi:ribonuclease H-like domain-containing protein [Flagelloscypha sp. PMI_526]|nr:ribonuclease H-like domain-containing protein [Flagelloscypha sp. PMI_526]